MTYSLSYLNCAIRAYVLKNGSCLHVFRYGKLVHKFYFTKGSRESAKRAIDDAIQLIDDLQFDPNFPTPSLKSGDCCYCYED